ncbi:hypothetical protein GEMRC1_004352 [Eukaryota sp. GEM-RC1]
MFFLNRLHHDLPDDCEFHLRNVPDIVLLSLALLYCVGVTAQICHLLVAAVETMAKKVHLSPSATGCTFLAAVSCAPELFIHVISLFGQESDLGTSTVIGSLVFNGLIGTGVACLSTTGVLRVEARYLIRDVAFWILSNFLLLVVLRDDQITWIECTLLFAVYVVYLVFVIVYDRIINKSGGERYAFTQDLTPELKALLEQDEEIIQKPLRKNTVTTSDSKVNSLPSDVVDSHYIAIDDDFDDIPNPNVKVASILSLIVDIALKPATAILHIIVPDCSKPRWKQWYIVTAIISLAILAGMEILVVEIVTRLGCFIGMSPAILGTILLAPLSSLPEAFGSIIQIRKGRANSALGNALGANVFSILVAMGVPWLMSTLITGSPIYMVDVKLVWNSFIVLLVAVFIVVALFLNSFQLTHRLGYIFFLVYLCYVVYIVLYDD